MATSIVSSSKTTWGFSPQSIPGLVWWLDGADTTSMVFSGTSTTLTSWKDKSGNGRNATAVNTPTLSATGAGVTLNGTNSYFTANTVTVPTSTHCLFAVHNPTATGVATAGSTSLFRFQQSGTTYIVFPWYVDSGGAKGYINSYDGVTIRYDTSTPLLENSVANTPNLIVANIAASSQFVYKNGNQQTSATGSITSGTSDFLTIGAADFPGTLTQFYSGTISEIIIFNNTLTDPQRQQIEGYLAAKWGLAMQLPTTHPYSAVVPFVPTQIAGCTLWLDAADSSTITGTSSVTAWTNKGTASGSGSRTAGTFNSTSTTINGVPAMALSSAAVMNMPSITFATTSRSVFLVVTIGARASAYTFVKAGSEQISPQVYSYYLQSDIQLNYSGKNLLVTASDPTNFFNKTSIVSITSEIYVNGTSQTLSINNLNSFPFQTGTSTTLSIGGSDTVAYVLGELIIFDGLLTTPQRQQVEQYLGQKWKIAVANAPSPGRYLIPTNRPFYPTDISGCALWLDSADASTVTGTSSVTAWRDKSGSGYSAVPHSGTIAQTTLNGQNALNFGTGVMRVASFTWTSSFTQIFVGYVTGGQGIIIDTMTSGGAQYGDYVYTGNGALMNVNNPANSGILQVYDTAAGSGTPVPTTNQWFIFCIGYGSTGTAAINYTLNGTVRSTTVYPATPPYPGGSATNPPLTLYINGTLNGTLAPGGAQIAELIHFNTDITATQRQQVEQYLAQKWGLVANLPPGHPGKLLPAFSTGFTVKSISGCQLWLDGGDTTVLTLSGTSVTSWGDKSGNGYSMNTLTPNPAGYTAIYPVIGTNINNQNTVFFSPTAGLKQSTVLTGVKNFYWIGRISSVGSTGYTNGFYSMLGTDNVINTNYLPWLGSNYGTKYLNAEYVSSGIRGATASQYTTDANAVVNTGFSNVNLPSNGNVALLSVNGITEGNGTTSYQGLCYDRGAHIGWCGDLGEVLIFSNALTTQQHQQVEGYLAWKWGLQSSLPSTHAYAKFAP